MKKIIVYFNCNISDLIVYDPQYGESIIFGTTASGEKLAINTHSVAYTKAIK